MDSLGNPRNRTRFIYLIGDNLASIYRFRHCLALLEAGVLNVIAWQDLVPFPAKLINLADAGRCCKKRFSRSYVILGGYLIFTLLQLTADFLIGC